MLFYSVPSMAANKGGQAFPKIKKSRSVTFERLPAGQYTIPVYINGRGPYQFMIDTAATRTSLFGKTARELGFENPNGKTRLVNGMVISGERPIHKAKSLIFANRTHKNHEIIVLPDWPREDDEKVPDGILGMDVLKDLIIRVRHKDRKVHFRAHGLLDYGRYRRWSKIRLDKNPYKGQEYGLKFTISRMGERFIPTLIDTGSSFSAINWVAVRGTFLDREKRRLRHDWEVSGAIGSFTPTMRIKIETFGIGGMYLHNPEILLMDFNELPINHYGKYPLLIAGTDLFDGRDFILDFKSDFLLVAPKRKKRKA